MKIVMLKKDEYDEFAVKHKLGSFYQSTKYGEVMSKFGFNDYYFGFVHNGNLVGVSLILSTPIFLGFKYGYAPHGLLINYYDRALIPLLIKKLKSFLFKQSFIIIKIDPLIIKSTRDSTGNIIFQENNIDDIMSILKNCGMTHCGFNLYLESVKPRWNAIINTKGKNATNLFNELEKQVRNKLRKAVKYGVEVYKDSNNDIEKVYEFIKNKGNYSIKYYKELKNAFEDNMEIYFCKLNTIQYVKNSQSLFQRESEINDYLNNIIQEEGIKGKNMQTVLNKKMESDKILDSYKNHLINATKLLKDYPDGINVGGAITIKYGNKLYLVIDGIDPQFKHLSCGYLLRWKILENHCYENSDIESYNLNAISGDFTNENNIYKGLNESKLGFGALATEYIGEFNLITNKPVYSIYRNTVKKYSLKKQKK